MIKWDLENGNYDVVDGEDRGYLFNVPKTTEMIEKVKLIEDVYEGVNAAEFADICEIDSVAMASDRHQAIVYFNCCDEFEYVFVEVNPKHSYSAFEILMMARSEIEKVCDQIRKEQEEVEKEEESYRHMVAFESHYW